MKNIEEVEEFCHCERAVANPTSMRITFT